MNYNTLQSLLPNDEIHYIDDCDQFFSDNHIDPFKFSNNNYILFEYTIECLPETNITTLIKKHEIELITKEILEGKSDIKEIKESLPSFVSYGKIRIVLAKNQ